MMWDHAGGGASLRAQLRERLRIPVIAAPMFLVSGPDLVIAACKAGVIGSFPTLNARTPEILEAWLQRMARETAACAPYAANLILHKSNRRLEADFELVVSARTPVVITSVGRPDKVVERVHAYGGLVLSDVASVRHARNAVAAGADGLVLLTAGAGGNSGWLNPFAFIAAVRDFFDGPIAVAGCVTNGRELRALEMLDADIGYMGTGFLAALESMAPEAHKLAVIECDADGIVLTDTVTGMPANFIRARLEEAGVIDASGTPLVSPQRDVHAWKDVWSAGQGVGRVNSSLPASAIVDALDLQYGARTALAALTGQSPGQGTGRASSRA